MTWRAQAQAIVDRVAASLPDDADLKARRRALRAARPWDFAGTSWGRKVWASVAREYLDRYRVGPREPGRAGLPLSPLEADEGQGGAAGMSRTMPPKPTIGTVHAGIFVSSPEDSRALLRAVEAGLRGAGATDMHKLHKWWVQLRNMRWRATVESWVGWND